MFKLNCKICNSEYETRNRLTLFCSENCRMIGKTQKKKEDKYLKSSFLIFQRDKFTCIYCGKNTIEDNIKLEADHIIPLSYGGQNTIDNIATSCQKCNRLKNDFILEDDILLKILDVIKDRNKKSNIRFLRFMPKTEIQDN